MAIPRLEDPERCKIQLFFLDSDPQACWNKFVQLGDDFAASELGRVIFAAPFVPTVVGTDIYTDELW